MKKPFTIGADVELFLIDSKNKPTPACGKFGGTKENPTPLMALPDFVNSFASEPDGFFYQEDNCSLEFNIPVCYNKDYFIKTVHEAMERLNYLVKGKGLIISSRSSVVFTAEDLLTPGALIFGCMPDYNAWTKRENRKPELVNPNERYAGGHVHIGTDENIIELTKRLDLFLGLPSVLWSEFSNRRKMYGKAGDIRPKPYGVEYRTLDNSWVFNKELCRKVYDAVDKAINNKIKLTQKVGKEIREVINTYDKTGAKLLMDKLEIEV